MNATGVTVTTPELMDIVGCTFRQIDYWARRGLVPVAGPAQPGSGSSRRYGLEGIFLAKIVNILSGFGFNGRPLDRAVRGIRDHSPAARLVYVNADGSTSWGPGAVAAIVIDLDRLREISSGNRSSSAPRGR